MKGDDCRKAGRWAHCQSGRMVVDSQSMMHVYEQRQHSIEYFKYDRRTIFEGSSGSTKIFSRLRS